MIYRQDVSFSSLLCDTLEVIVMSADLVEKSVRRRINEYKYANVSGEVVARLCSTGKEDVSGKKKRGREEKEKENEDRQWLRIMVLHFPGEARKY